jgi:proteic killer suppression protein
MPIKSIRHKGLWLLHEGDDARGVPADLADRLRDMLAALATAETIEDVGVVPGWQLHPFERALVDCWTLTVARNCWLVFRFEDGGAVELDLIDNA